METDQLIQAAASIASAMAASRYGKFGGMEEARITDIAVIAVRIARAIEVESQTAGVGVMEAAHRRQRGDAPGVYE